MRTITCSLSFSIRPRGLLTLSENVLKELNNYRQVNSGDTEAGGILLGHQFNNRPDVIIDEITTPLVTDKRSRHGFYRSKGHHHIAVNKWKRSDGRCLYMGLWHTHPEPSPLPSGKDKYDWEKAITKGTFEGDQLFFIIVGTENICCWRGFRTKRFRRLLGTAHNFHKLNIYNERI